MNTQMNVRLDSQLKRSGDEAFANAGLTPSQVVRTVWEFGSRHRDEPQVIRQAFASRLEQLDRIEVETEIAQIEHATSICARLREEFGLTPPDQLEDINYRALREEAALERMSERGLL